MNFYNIKSIGHVSCTEGKTLDRYTHVGVEVGQLGRKTELPDPSFTETRLVKGKTSDAGPNMEIACLFSTR